MRAKLLHELAGARKYALTFSKDDEILTRLSEFVREKGLRAACFSAIGSLSHAALACFSDDRNQYIPIPIEGPAEILMLSGRITMPGQTPQISAHALLGKPDGTARGGGLLSAFVHHVVHLFVEESLAPIHREQACNFNYV